MRLYTMYYLCKNNIDDIKDIRKVFGERAFDEVRMRVENWDTMRRALDNLYNIEYLKESIDQVYNVITRYDHYQPILQLTEEVEEEFRNKVKVVEISVQTLINLYESLGYEQSTNNLEIRIPDGLNLDEASILMDDLNKIITQCPFIEREDGIGNIVKTDVGSIWLVLLGTSAFLKTMGCVVDVAIKARDCIMGFKMYEQILKEQELKVEILNEVKTSFSEYKQKQMANYIAELSEKTGKKLTDGDEEGRAIKCLEKLDKWMDRGMRIYAAIDTPREIQKLFPEQPDIKNLTEEVMKLIETKEK